jgi:demethylmenaquinone methyltransferase / 2-methoxy-6-polyprenyl-1,4-benzoquinol methylase
MAVLPNSASKASKKEQVEQMFDDIAPNYDKLNHILSFQIDNVWRKRVRNKLAPQQPQEILDIATGTADLAIELSKLKPKHIIGLDLSAQMLAAGEEKIKAKKLTHIISLEKGDSEAMRFEDNRFDAITVSFGVRNFEHLEKGLSEIHRVLKPGKAFIILEFSKVKSFPMKQLYGFYSRYIIPLIGKLFSKNNEAYTYLPNSVQVFPEGEEMCLILKNIGFTNIICKRLTFGIASMYYCEK